MPDDDTPPAGDTPPVDDTPPAGDTPPADDTPPAGDTPPDDGTVLTGKDGPQGAPEKYANFNIPDGMEMDTALMEVALPLFKQSGLSQIQAQEYVDMFAGNVQAKSLASSDSYDQVVKDWVIEGKSDKEIGGDKYAENVGIAKRGMDFYGTPKLVQVLHDTGLGSHPEFIRLFNRIGKLIKEDDPGGDDRPTGEAKTPAEILYPTEAKKGAAAA